MEFGDENFLDSLSNFYGSAAINIIGYDCIMGWISVEKCWPGPNRAKYQQNLAPWTIH